MGELSFSAWKGSAEAPLHVLFLVSERRCASKEGREGGRVNIARSISSNVKTTFKTRIRDVEYCGFNEFLVWSDKEVSGLNFFCIVALAFMKCNMNATLPFLS